jgi:hypothetical protein
MQEAPTEQLPRLDTTCPSCGAPAEHGQLVCLECGGRIALDYRRPPGWKLPAAVVALVLLAGAAGFAIGLNEITSDAESEVASEPPGKPAGRETPRPGRRQPKPGANRRGERPARTRRPRPRRRPRARPRRAVRGAVSGWPARRNAFTVVILSAGDRPGAVSFARGLARNRVRAGVLRSDDYTSLEPGFWIVFSGVYRRRAQAEEAAARLGQRYNGAFPQFVNGASRRRRR